MATSLSVIQKNYVQNFPTEVPTKATQSFIVTTGISLFAGSASNVALLGGALAATSTLIEAVTRPIIKAVFPENTKIAEIIQIVMPKMIVLSLAVRFGVTYQVTSFVLIRIITWIALNRTFYERNVGMVEVL